MARLKVKFKKEKIPFSTSWQAVHEGDTSMSIDEQRKGMEFMGKTLSTLCLELKALGYDPDTIYFSIKTKY